MHLYALMWVSERAARTGGVSVIIEAPKVADVSAWESPPVTASALASARPKTVHTKKIPNCIRRGYSLALSLRIPENLIVNYGEVNRQSETIVAPPTEKTTPHETTGKSRDRVGSSGCLYPERDIRPPQRPQLGRSWREYHPGKNFLRGEHRGRSWHCGEEATKCY